MTPKGTYFDLQVNGYAGVDFNQDALTADQLHHACTRLEADGVDSILATIITEDLALMRRRLANLAALRRNDPLAKERIAGFHIEGPFINETDGYRGAHPRDAIRPADVESMQSLLDAADGLTKIVTLAPERDPGMKVTKMLAACGIVVSAGHTDASIEQLREAIDAGLSMFTHFGNGCPMQMHRHDNIVQRALSLSDQLWLCFIVDGAHVPFVALGNYLKIMNHEKCIVVTDCVAPAGLGPGRYTLGRWDIAIGEDMVVRSPDGSHFIGSGITMTQSVENLRGKLGLSDETIRRLTYDNPRRAIKISPC